MILLSKVRNKFRKPKPFPPQRVFCVRHNSGEMFEVQGYTTWYIRKQIEAECHDRGWLVDETEWWEVKA